MGIQLLDENNIRSLSPDERFLVCEQILKNEKDESKRWDAVWLIGELAEKKDQNDPMFRKVSDVLEWILNMFSLGFGRSPGLLSWLRLHAPYL